MPSMHERLYWRETGDPRPHSRVKGLYGDKRWVQDLDIVNELGGHTGCVNALSWSKTGQLLASGSDDTHIAIHSYQPQSSTSPFVLSTSLSTGHTANIFSVKFMPHSNDRTVVSAAGDAEVRVFDLEYDGQSKTASDASNIAYARQRRRARHRGSRYLNDGNTNARVYRSHADRVKRIVTESSPHLFLTCSEDGTVRQWDLRLPSSAYPPPRGGRGFASHREGHDDSNVPPPLISYKRYRLDLNTISCSASQPHYIALGGAHLHCFLHDRRMIGRDLVAERGASLNGSCSSTEGEDNLMGEATRCVRRFAPNGRNKMRRHDNGHMTACKISDAHPNELIGSWSGDHIYSFDMLQTPDARELAKQKEPNDISGSSKGKAKEFRERKRKRKQVASSSSIDKMEAERSKSQHTDANEAENGDQDDDMVLRLRYENGQSEDIPIESMAEQARESVLTDAQKRSSKIAKSMVKIRRLLFSLDASSRDHSSSDTKPLAPHQSMLSSVLSLCASMIPEMREIERGWLFETRPSSSQAALQVALRINRSRTLRWVQAVGCLARALGGEFPLSESQKAVRFKFEMVPVPPIDGNLSEPEKAFGYYFLMATLVWLEKGPEGLVEAFRWKNSTRWMPIPEDRSDVGAIDDYVIPWLMRMAGRQRLADVDASRFERDESRNFFDDEKSALVTFSRAVKIPLQNLSRETAFAYSIGASTSHSNGVSAQDRETARFYWGFRVGRSLLMNAGEGIDYAHVDRAYGGLGTAGDEDEGRVQEDVDPEAEEQRVQSASIKRRQALQDRLDAVPRSARSRSRTRTQSREHGAIGTEHDEAEEEDEIASDEIEAEVDGNDSQGEDEGAMDDEDEDEDDDNDAAYGEGGEEEEDEDDDNSEIDFPLEDNHFLWRSLRFSNRAEMRDQAQKDIPVGSHMRVYKGHCNIKTIKDVNFFGQQDEYIVSGSDSGHFFIWDRKTQQLLNILEGDGEVVNVVQGT